MLLEEEISRRLASFEQVRFALLFGSSGSGRGRPDSDLDVAVYLDEALSPSQRLELRVLLGNELVDLGQPDLVVLNDAPPVLGHRALLGKKVLVRDRRCFVRYFVRTISAAQDERHFALPHRQEREARIREGRFGRS